MEVHYFHGKHPNFGDDLNATLWQHVLPAAICETDDILLFGVGSILNEERISIFRNDRRRKIILGSGTSYGSPPSDLSDWHTYAVRGPLTAALIDMPDAAITDAAILVADHAANYVEDRPDGGSRTVIIPHHYSLDGARWAEVADAAGMRFVSPRSTVTEIVSQISNADLVITEAMHGAILADTLRVPWIPVQCSPDFDSFKWRDWAMSMDLTFSPIKVAPTSAQKALSYWRKSKAAHHYVPFPDSLDVSAPGMRDLLTDHLQSRYRSWGGSSGQAGDRARLKEALALFDGFFVSRVSRTLKDIARTPPFLSTDAMFKTRLHQMRGAVDRFVEDAISRQI